MNTARLRRPELWWLLLAAALLLVAAGWCGWIVVSKYQQAAARLAQLEPRYARLAGIQQHEQALEQDAAALGQNLAHYAHPADTEAGPLANATLQLVRDLAGKHGLSVTSSQTSAPQQQEGFDRIGIDLVVQGDWPGLTALLTDLALQQPLIYYELLQLNSEGMADGVARALIGRLNLYVLQERAS